MKAMLRYLLLKTQRDGSFWAFLALPALFPIGALVGPIVGTRHFVYPLYMNSQFTPVANATLVADITGACAIIFASIVAFWVLRPEVASHAIGSFLFGARPLTIVVSVMLFATAIEVTAFAIALVVIKVLAAAWPANILFIAFRTVMVTILLSAAGVLLLMISPQPAMMIGTYVFALTMIPLEKRPLTQMAIAAIVTVVCVTISTFLLERRCAT